MGNPYWQSPCRNHVIHVGDCLDVLGTLDAESVQTCITSPPYFGLRDYGTAEWEGGDAGCDHLGKPHSTQAGFNERYTGKAPVETNKQGELREPFGDICGKCGARRIDAQLGLEPTPEEYIAKMVEVFRGVRRVLRGDGTVWLNIGDSYAGSGRGGYAGNSGTLQGTTDGQDESRLARERSGSQLHAGLHESAKRSGAIGRAWVPPPVGLKNKDLIGIPWRLAFALQADGWYLRQDIIWHKPNPMPESVTDRCTKAHEYLFLLAKQPQYYYDHEAIQEAASCAGQSRGGSTNRYEQNLAGMDCKEYETRNKRSVWTVLPATYKAAHFATYPPKLIEPCVLAGCPVGGTVLDPFTGSGTTGMVAAQHGRRFVGIELNPEYADMAVKRVGGEADHLFARVDHEARGEPLSPPE